MTPTQNVPVAETIPDQSACIVDAMSIIQKLDGNGKTFQDLAKYALKMVIREGGDNSEIVDVIFDVYQESSIKDTERVNRGAGSGVRFNNISAGPRIKQWRSFLPEAHNKTMLLELIVEEWKSNDSKAIIGNKTLYVTCGEKCWKITRCETSLVDELQSSQEEADTRILFHAKHASDHGYMYVVVVSEDTDVYVLCIAFAKDIKGSFYQKRGTKTRTRYLDIKQVRALLGDRLSQAFTCCDSVSAFSGRGKTGPLKQLRKDKQAKDTFIKLGNSWDVTQLVNDTLQAFTCHMYASSSKTTKVNVLRHEMFVIKRGEVDSSTLPPCEDSLQQHIQ